MCNVHGFIASQGIQIPNQQPSKPLRDRRAIAELARITSSQTKRRDPVNTQGTGLDSPSTVCHDGEPTNLKRFIQKSKAQSPLDPNESDYNSFDDTSTTLETVTGERSGSQSKGDAISSNLDDIYGLNDGLDGFLDGRVSESDIDYSQTHDSFQHPPDNQGPSSREFTVIRDSTSAVKGHKSPPIKILERHIPDGRDRRHNSYSASPEDPDVDHEYQDNHHGKSPNDARSSADHHSRGEKEQDDPPRETNAYPNRSATRSGTASILEAQMQVNTEGVEHEHGVQSSKHAQQETSKPSTPGVESPLTDDLDYEPAQFSAISFSDLRNQSFDEDPKATGSVLSAQWTERPLKDQLMHASSLPPTLQRPFLNALSIHQWDEAGEWFVQQFTELVGKLSAARREKRKVAERFEDEVAERQKKVMRQDQRINSELQGMKLGGTSLLERHNTPKPGV
jgi:hypothetical protein